MDDLQLIERQLYHLMAVHMNESKKPVTEERRAYLVGVSNGLRLAREVVAAVVDDSKNIDIDQDLDLVKP